MSARERRFVRALLERRTNLWVLRTSQHGSSGDFVVVDMSSPVPERRTVLVLELKRGAPVERASPEMHQVRNARAAVAATARLSDAISAAASYEVLVGDPDELLQHFVAGIL